MVPQLLERIGVQRRRAVMALAHLAKEVVGQALNVFLPLAQGRQVDGHAFEAKEEIHAKGAVENERFHFSIGGRQHTHVHLDRLTAADAGDLAVLQDTQQFSLAPGAACRRPRRGKTRAAVGMLEVAFCASCPRR